MQVSQIYELMNTVTEEVLGETNLVQEDLGNIVDVGTSIFNANAVDNYCKSLVNHIGKIVFVNRKYSGNIPSVLMDSWEFGSVLQKIDCELPEATENESYELEGGSSYDPNIFYKPTVTQTFFNKRSTFEVPMSFTEKQVKESFSNVEQLNGFISMLYNAVDKSMTIKIDGLIMRTINNMIGETMHAEVPGGTYTGRSGVKAVNLLYLYNTRYSKTLSAANCLTDPDFVRYASYIMGLYTARLSKISSLFNIEGKERFTPADMLHFVTLADFQKAADVFLQSDTFHNEYVALPKAETVPFWQGSGTSYAFSSTGEVKVKTASGDTVDVTGVIGVMFDRDTLGVTNIDRRVTSNYNPKAEFYTNWHKWTCGAFNSLAENFVVFYVAAA